MTLPLSQGKLRVLPLEPERWGDFERLFGAHGAYGGCWCMWWRITRKEFKRGKGEGNRLAMRKLVEEGMRPGMLGYLGDRAVAWCSAAPRSQFGALNRSPVLRAIDDSPVWSIVCFYIEKGQRGKGLMLAMLEGVKDAVRDAGGTCLEAYPTIPKSQKAPPVSSFMGLPAVFHKAGFTVVAKPSPSKLIMRCALNDD